MLQPTSDTSGNGPRKPLHGASATGYRSIAYRVPVALHARLKAAWWATRDEPDGAPSLAGLVERAFTEEASRLEQLHNAGAPFPPAPLRAQGTNPRGVTGYGHRAYYLPVALHARLKAAWWASRANPDGAPSLAGLVERAFTEEASRLEQLHNAGAPFPPAPDTARGVSRAAAERQGEWLRAEWERRRQDQATETD
ncbi:hypothetical protein ACPW96_18375 [Micromonospora sp. DT81.3]|uniref:hypothetical protein n=1 Tax=Micromonospora sp. DT81.3 TaxID=3416523 RepID=UPI003CF67EAF